LSKRIKCVRIVKNYAKNFVLKIFDNYVDKRKDNPEMSHILNLYLYVNATVLNVFQNYKYMIDTNASYFKDWNKYIADTEPMRQELIIKIREKILGFN
jgi:hypothetical protein